MKDAWSTADLGILKTRPQRAVWYLAVHRPASVYSASIANTLATFPASALNVTNIGGVAGDVKAGMTLRVGANASGSSKGIIRVREDMTGSVIQIAEAGCGLINFQQNDVVTVMNQFLPWTKHIREDSATSKWLVDFQSYNNELNLYGPHVNIGPPAAVFLDGGTATVPYISSRSFSASVASDVFDTYAWVFPDGVTNAGRGTEDASIDMVYLSSSTGGSYVSLTVTDSNGVTGVGRRLVWAFDDRTQPHRVEFADIVGGIRKGGYKANLKVSTTATAEEFPDMAEIVIFEEASYGGTASTIGGNYPWRSNIVFRGWIDGKTVNINPFSGDVMFSAVTIDGILNKAESYDSFLGDVVTDASAIDWVGASALTTDRTAWNLLTNRSTAGTLVDFSSAGGFASKIQTLLYQEMPRSSFWKQLARTYREYGNYGYVAADMQSSIYGMNDAQITGGSAALPLNEITKADRRGTVVVKEKSIDENVEAHFLSVTSDIPIWVRSPGDVMGYFGKKKEHAKGMYADQQTLTQWVGNWAAKLNSNYPATTIPLAGNLRYDSVPQSRISMSLSATDNVRGYSWDDKEFFPYQTKLQYNSESGTVLTDIEVEEIVNGVGGSAVTFPAIVTTPTPEPEPDIEPEPIPGPTLGDGFGTAYVMLSTGIARTRDLSAASPTWVSITSGTGGTRLDFILDPWHPTTRAFCLTTAGVYRGTNMDTDTPTWTLILTSATIRANTGNDTVFIIGPKIQMSINAEDYIGFSIETTALGANAAIYYIYSTDAGDTWNYIFVMTPGGLTFEACRATAFDIVPWSSDGNLTIYMPIAVIENDTHLYEIWKSTDSGATWVRKQRRGTTAQQVPTCCNTPYTNNEDGNEVWVAWRKDTDAISTMFKSTDGFDTWPSEIDLPGTDVDFTRIKRLGIEIYVPNNNQIAIWAADNKLFKSTNGGTSWSEISFTGYVPGTHGTVSGAGGFPSAGGQYYLVTDDRYVFVSINGGSTWIEKTGNLQSVIGSNGAASWGIRLGVIVPVWVEE